MNWRQKIARCAQEGVEITKFTCPKMEVVETSLMMIQELKSAWGMCGFHSLCLRVDYHREVYECTFHIQNVMIIKWNILRRTNEQYQNYMHKVS